MDSCKPGRWQVRRRGKAAEGGPNRSPVLWRFVRWLRHRERLNFPHCQIAIRADREVRSAEGKVLLHESRYFVTSLDPAAVTPPVRFGGRGARNQSGFSTPIVLRWMKLPFLLPTMTSGMPSPFKSVAVTCVPTPELSSITCGMKQAAFRRVATQLEPANDRRRIRARRRPQGRGPKTASRSRSPSGRRR